MYIFLWAYIQICDVAYWPCRWRPHFLWRSFVFSVSRGTRVLQRMSPPPPRNSQRWTRKSKIPCDMRSVIRVFTEKIFIRLKLTGRLLKCMVKVQRTKGIWENAVDCLKNAGQCATRLHTAVNKRSLLSSGGKFSRPPPPTIQFLYLASRDYHLKKFLAVQILRGDQETKDALQYWLEGLATSFCNVGVLKLVPRYAKYVN